LPSRSTDPITAAGQRLNGYYYLYDPDPDRLELSGFVRRDDNLIAIDPMHGHVSRHLRVKFEMAEDGLRLIAPDGRSFATYGEVALDADQARRDAESQRNRAQMAEERAGKLEAQLERLRREAKG
jgi:hypothetical protein